MGYRAHKRRPIRVSSHGITGLPQQQSEADSFQNITAYEPLVF